MSRTRFKGDAWLIDKTHKKVQHQLAVGCQLHHNVEPQQGFLARSHTDSRIARPSGFQGAQIFGTPYSPYEDLGRSPEAV